VISTWKMGHKSRPEYLFLSHNPRVNCSHDALYRSENLGRTKLTWGVDQCEGDLTEFAEAAPNLLNPADQRTLGVSRRL